MITLFTKKYGKISAGYRGAGRKGKGGTASAVQPFAYGEYQLYEGRNYCDIDRAEVIRSFYGIGEDLDRYASAGYVLELTDRVLVEGMPQPEIFDLLIAFLGELEKRKTRFRTLVLAFEIQLLDRLGVLPALRQCASCGKTEGLTSFSVSAGGMICQDCARKLRSEGEGRLIYEPDFDMIKITEYFSKHPLRQFRNLALNEKTEGELQRIVRAYLAYHLDVGRLKSEGIFTGEY